MRTWPAIEAGRLSAAATDLFEAALTDYDVAAIDEHAPDAWRVFFPTSAERDRAAADLRRTFPDLVITAVDVPDEDWAARSQADLHAVQAGRIIVAPPWDVPETAAAPDQARPAIAIVIQPSMGFGTGHHATTRLCLLALQQIDLHGRTVLDIGTGSGVLAIAASLLGAPRVIAIDDDIHAIASARENVSLNPAARVDLEAVDVKAAALTPCDLLLANLTGGLLIQVAARLRDLAAPPAGRLILSGFMHHEEPAVLAAYPSFRVVDRSQEDEWMCVTLQRDGAFV